MKLNRRQIRAIITEELSIISRRKSINEVLGIGSIVGMVALSALALAGVYGVSYLAVSSLVDAEINRDPRVKQKLEDLGQLVSENPEMKPADIARMAARNDAELAAIIQDIELKISREFSELASAMPTSDHTGDVARARAIAGDLAK